MFEKYLEMYGSKFEEQLQLEALAKNEAEEHTRRQSRLRED